MDFVNSLFKSGLVKILIFVLFIYFVYEKTKNDPRSFSNTIKNQDIKKNVSNFKENYTIIKKAREGAVAKTSAGEEIDELDNLEYDIIRTGYGELESQCNDEVKIEYILISTNGNIASKSIISIIAGEGFNKILEKVLIGMRVGEVRTVNIPKTFSTGDKKYDHYIQTRDMVYQITMLEINKTIGNNYVCK